jgi:hypothetical protein
MQRVLDHITDTPAIVMTPTHDILAWNPLVGAGTPRAASERRVDPQARSHGAREADPAGASDRAAGRRGKDEPRRCRGALPQPKDGRVPPDTRLPQAQHPLPSRTRPALLLRARARDAWCRLVPADFAQQLRATLDRPRPETHDLVSSCDCTHDRHAIC